MSVQIRIIGTILGYDDSPYRFEDFCRAIYSESEGIDIVATSRSWDLGRDGRSIHHFGGKIKTTLLATLKSDIDDKIESDLSRISETTVTNSIVYCTNKPISEKKCSEIQNKIKEYCPSVDSTQVLGQYQLASLAEHYYEIFRKYYNAEIASIEKTLLRPVEDRKESEVGLRLALLTHESEDSVKLKNELTKNLILDVISNKHELNPEQISGEISSMLHLPRTISIHYTKQLLSQLETNNLVLRENNKYRLSESGEELTRNIPQNATAKLLEGRIAIKEAISKLTGLTIKEEGFKKLWDIFQDNMTNLFHSHGLAIVKMMRSALSEEEWKQDRIKVEIPLNSFAERVASIYNEPQYRDEIKQAIIDMFFERDSEAFKWLTQVCGIYVMMCTLGFETLSREQMIKTLSCFHLVPDSDIVISLLCYGEDNHNEVENITTGWQSIGGSLSTSTPVLEEVAYHAWISEYDYNTYEDDLSKLSDNEARHYIDNAFVRSFRKESDSSTDRHHWDKYIKQYRGSVNHYSFADRYGSIAIESVTLCMKNDSLGDKYSSEWISQDFPSSSVASTYLLPYSSVISRRTLIT